MPEHPEIRELLSGSNINFFNCKKIVEILKETEKDSKNFFGQYGSQRMTDWKEVLRLYENESIYLAEASQLLIQAVVYELPGLKKQITKVSLLSLIIKDYWIQAVSQRNSLTIFLQLLVGSNTRRM